ncbi:glycosyltransferase [Methanobrevibacter filiformis]|uniref:N-acetylgalactosamine-N, N'-diacetylbacillosaminyl-diphospho-undecaprenol 4-alpha-N-acetylgalactosaminyltransferase n=1 Tax=Methanobrevibacter filiformis TaxID=55758 RepID=A0A166DGW5_9EURY|nr:glycosyltransferase [Methanobrevibacter filiformis]KZX15586.1 N-acetylgalactosamine-N,N'-diacetylbacillosaminyl-diphospho-undecaprenol 4-alpha-N-acetylgalactosaminyltransferase [Methanobrevibacter filiformis]
MNKKINKIKKLWKRQKKYYNEPKTRYDKNIAGFKRVVDYTERYKNNNIDSTVILIESMGGKNISLSIYNILSKIIDESLNYSIYLSLNNKKLQKILPKKILEKITIIYRNSTEYLDILTTATILFTDGEFPSFYIRKDNQKLINTLEYFSGYNGEKELLGIEKQISRTLLHTTHILLNENYEENILKHHHLNGVKSFYIINDFDYYFDCYDYYYFNYSDYYFDYFNFDDCFNESYINNSLCIVNLKLDSNFSSKEKIQELYYKLLSKEDIDTVIFLVHISKYKKYSELKDIGSHVQEDNFQKVELIKKAKIFISDDDILLKKTPNMKEMKKFILTDDMELFSFDEQKTMVNTVNYSVHEIIENQSIWVKNKVNKKNILFYCGGFFSNGITSSLINLSNNIDYEKYNVILIDRYSHDKEKQLNIDKLNPKINLLYRVGQKNVTISECRIFNFVTERRGMRGWLKLFDVFNLFKREYRRVFGDLPVDMAVDFSGYVPFWTALFAFSDAKKKVVYQHNDLHKETMKKVNGKYPHKENLPRVFSLYKYYDNILSVGKETMEVNISNLSKWTPRSKYIYLPNSINPDIILEKANSEESLIKLDNKYKFLIKELIGYHNNYYLAQTVPIPNKENFNFLNIGRLSPEKGQIKLIKAFYNLKLKTNKPVKLFILGEGALKEKLEKLIKKLSLETDVFLLGQIDNPYLYMKNSDLYISSSNHEGQPIVLLEVLTIGLPILATNIPGNLSVLKESESTIVENTQNSLTEAMLEFVEQPEKLISPNFDYINYNKRAMAGFYELLS